MQPVDTLPRPAPPGVNDALFLDIDGTLIEIAETPDGVQVPSQLPDLLDRIYNHLGGAVALVTGRPLVDVDRLFPKNDLPVFGQHGLERRHVDGRVETLVEAVGLDEVEARLTDAVRSMTGVFLERKSRSLAVHFRAAPHWEDSLLTQVNDTLAPFADHLTTQGGKMVYEIKPKGFNKGTAVSAFMQEAPFGSRRPIFVGDDVTDDYGFDAVRKRGGTAVIVGDRTPHRGTHRLSDPRDVLAWLDIASR